MLPSKLVDYIDTGKPILNICQLEECPSLEYTKKYPMAADVLPTEDLEETKIRVQIFASKYAGKQLEHEYIENALSEYTAMSVARTILLYIETQ